MVKKKQKLIIDHVPSGGLASFRLCTPYKDFEKEIAAHTVHSSQFLKDSLNGKVLISGLFNAYTEKMFVDRIHESGTDVKKLFPDGIYADSGGLQVVTQKKKIDDAMKKKIYDVQATYADYAMSFDEIPFKILDNGSRVYQPDKVSDCGFKAGDNLKEQLDYFNSIEAKTKIFPIVQGLGFDDMRTYTENMLSKLDASDMNSLECLAVGGLTTEFELIERAMNLYSIDTIDDKVRSHLHLLGLTGFQRLMPILIVAKNGMLKGLKKISFDSTTFTKSYLLGSITPSFKDYQNNRTSIRALGKIRDEFNTNYYEEMFEWWKNNPDNIFDDAEDMMEHSCFNSKGFTTGAQQYKGLGLEHGVKTIVQKHTYIYYNTYKFLSILEDYLEDKIQLEDFMYNYKHLHLLKALEKVTTKEDFDELFIQIKSSTNLKNEAVMDGSSTTSCLF